MTTISRVEPTLLVETAIFMGVQHRNLLPNRQPDFQAQ
jgi:hypothetical protein